VVDTVPRTALAIGIDIGDPGNIHPANKQEAGRRLALAALHGVYALDVIASGPKVASVRFEADRAVLTFDAGGQRQQIVMKPGGESGFELAGADGRFHPAQAQAAGSAITLTSAAVSAPRSIRYAWRDNPRAALFNTAGLPAAPFHTESTEGRTP
jgi:sialate O-acetylesterase